jgi:hypothetical protein
MEDSYFIKEDILVKLEIRDVLGPYFILNLENMDYVLPIFC